jgi:uncharacterized Ntn-hydrolase superfamily protein
MLKTPTLLLCLATSFATGASGQDTDDPTSVRYDPDANASTYSIIVRDPETDELGIGVASRVLAVGRNGSTFKGGVGVIVHQASSDSYYGRVGMEMLDAGLDPQEAMARLVRSDLNAPSRQVAMLDFHGRSAAFTGAACPNTADAPTPAGAEPQPRPNCGSKVGLAVYSHPRSGPEDPWRGHKCGVDYCAQANTMMGPEVVDNMARSFESTGGSGKTLSERIVDALDAGLSQGADMRGQQSAALFIVKKLAGSGGYSDLAEDLRVNDHPHPLNELRRLLTLRQSGGIIAGANRAFAGGDPQGALQTVLGLKDRIPENDGVWIALAGMYTRLDRRADALAAIRTAVEINPYNARRAGLPANATFESLRSDPEWVRIMSVWPLEDPCLCSNLPKR